MLAKGLREQSYAVDIAADGEVALYQPYAGLLLWFRDVGIRSRF
jgi:hypothetical protein